MAGGANAYHSDEAGAGMICDINVTPLVDITLVLLIIFMVTAKLIVARAVEIDTPKTATGQEVGATVEVALGPGGEVFVNGEPVASMQDVETAMRRAVKRDPDIRPIITADARVPHGDVMAVVDAVKLAGAHRFAVTTDVKATSQ